MSLIARGTPVGRIGILWCTYEFLGEFVLLYALETLLFVDTGLSTGAITSLLIVWSLTSVVCEVPSGVLADVLPRRLLIAAAPLLRSVGFGLWVFVPSYPMFLIGFMLWGVSGALQSGATEALVYDDLKHFGATGRFATYAGRARAAGTVAVLASMLLAPTVYGSGGYTALGIGSIATGVATAVVALSFPEHREERHAEFAGMRAYGRTLAAGLREVRGDRKVLFTVAMVAVILSIWGSLEEFGALLAVEFGANRQLVPYLVAALTAGITVGALLAGRLERWPWRRLGLWLGAGGLALLVGALYGGIAGFVVLVAAFAVFNSAGIVCEVRLQDAIRGPARATVTSVAGLCMDLGAIPIYALYALAATYVGHSGGFALGGAAYLVVAVLIVVAAATATRRRTPPGPPTSSPTLDPICQGLKARLTSL